MNMRKFYICVGLKKQFFGRCLQFRRSNFLWCRTTYQAQSSTFGPFCVETALIKNGQGLPMYIRVARWYIFTPKIAIWVNFGRSCNGRCRYIVWPFDIFYGNLVYFVQFDIFYPVLVLIVPRKILQPERVKHSDEVCGTRWPGISIGELIGLIQELILRRQKSVVVG
jgi:hypothetical protein